MKWISQSTIYDEKRTSLKVAIGGICFSVIRVKASLKLLQTDLFVVALDFCKQFSHILL